MRYDCVYATHGNLVSDLLQKTQSWTGPFVALYAGMMDFSSFNNSQNGLAQDFIILFINAAMAVVLVLPLVALVVVLFWRIIMLWLAIALSPFLVLKEVFKELLGKFGDKLDFLNIGELTKLLFAPVMIGFAISMSLMFMSILKVSLKPVETEILDKGKREEQQQLQKQRIKEATGMEFTGTGDAEELSILGFVKISAKSTVVNFTWLILQIFGLALTWSLVFRAVRMTRVGESF